MRDTYYFSHDIDAHSDIKIATLLCDYGAAGYGMYWIILELMRAEESIALTMKPGTFRAIKSIAHCDVDVEQFVNDCIELELFVTDGTTFWSESLRRRTDKVKQVSERRSAAGKKGMQARYGKQTDSNAISNVQQSYSPDIATPNNKIKENKRERSTTKSSVFEPLNRFLSLIFALRSQNVVRRFRRTYLYTHYGTK